MEGKILNINEWSDQDRKTFGSHLQWNSYRSKRRKLLYVSTPKVACTSLKWWFASLEGYADALRASGGSSESDPDLVVHDLFHQVAPTVTGLPLEGLTEALTSPEYFRFAVVRNPFKRVFSAWQSKLLLREPLQIPAYLDEPFFDYPIESPEDIGRAFEGFLEHLAAKEAPNFWDHHWTPQADILRPDLINYTKISKIEEPRQMSEALTRWLSAEAPDPFSVRRANESFIPFLPDFLSQRSIELIRHLYASDFRSFDYDTKIPNARETFSPEQWKVALKAVSFARARHQVLGQRSMELEEVRSNLTAQYQQVSNLDEIVAIQKAEVCRLLIVNNELESLNENLEDEVVRLYDVDNELRSLKVELAAVLNSRSWRWTRPLRKGGALIAQVKTVSGAIDGPLLQRLRRARRELRLHSALRDVRSSALFDADYYRTTYPDVSESGLDPATHFVVHGWKEHRNPSAAFDTAFYLSENPDIAGASINPFLHYIRHGRQEGRRISASETVSLIEIDPEELEREIDTIRLSGQFDEQFYVCVYPELQLTPKDAIRHYCEHGWRQGRDPNDDFDTQFYLSTYDDIRNAGMNPFLHYVVSGAAEARRTADRSGGRREVDAWFGEIDNDVKLIAFYALPDWDVLRSARPLFPHHSQPKKPDGILSYYDVASADVLRNQAEMATRHGVSAFCFELTNATRLDTDRKDPLALFLENEDINIRFCVRADVSTGADENLSAIGDTLVRLSNDERCLRVDGRPLVVVEAAQKSLQVSRYVPALIGWFREQGLDEPFIVGRCVLGDAQHTEVIELLSSGCNAVLDFPANPVPGETGDFRPYDRNGVQTVPYNVVCANGMKKARIYAHLLQPAYAVVTLARDNTPQQTDGRLVYRNFSTDSYRQWLDECIAATRKIHPEDRRFVFIDAWNDWENGLYLEPDLQGGFNRLNETARALLKLEAGLRLPKISIIVPNYNHKAFLRQRLESIYAQTYRNIEVLLLDDCSSDGSREILDEYLAKYPSVTRVIYNAENSGGPFKQWARGLKEASGELVWIAESDDFCDERFLEVLVRCFDDEAVLLAYGKSIFVNRDGAPDRNALKAYLADLACAAKWESAYVETAHNEVQEALGIKNTIPNASSVLFKRPIDLPLLEDEQWLAMRVAGDWVFYLHVIRGGKVAYNPDAINFFRRYEGSAAEATYKKDSFYREVGLASRTVAALYQVPLDVLERCCKGYEAFYWRMVGNSEAEFSDWYNYEAVIEARSERSPNVLVSTMGFYPGGAEILPIRLANEFKRQGLSVLLLSTGLVDREDGVRQMLRNDVPLIETSSVTKFKETISEFHIEALNTHQWHIQKYPLLIPDVFDDLQTHVASLHGMIEHGEAFSVTEEQLFEADRNVTTWAYTADKNLGPFKKVGIHDASSPRFQKIQNGMQPPKVVPVSRAQLNIPENAFVLCCVSRAIPDKGWAEAIDAVERARRLSGRDVRLILVGNGPVYDDYCKTSVPDFVYLAGFSENSVGYYAAADMGIMLTKFKSESFPLTIVDCLFAGRPYIGTGVGEIENMLTVEGELAGAVIGLDDWEVPVEQVAHEIAEFASDHTKYSKALSLVLPAASRYRIDVVASQYIALFERDRDGEPIGIKKVKTSSPLEYS